MRESPIFIHLGFCGLILFFGCEEFLSENHWDK